MNDPRLFLSPPCVDAAEADAAAEAVRSGWVAPVGPDLRAFESDLESFLGHRVHAVALSSGTAALHLALLTAGVQPGDAVPVSTFSFVASANAIRYCGAEPIFIDSHPETWNMDPGCLIEALRDCHHRGQRIGAVVFVDLFGSCAGIGDIVSICQRQSIPLIEDAAESVGSSLHRQPAGTFGQSAVFSFNGNKILTTGGGGMFLSANPETADQVRHLSTQAREPAIHYEHIEIGYNYRMSNILAAIGRVQLSKLGRFIQRRREIRSIYENLLSAYPGIHFNPIPPGEDGTNHWLTIAILPSPQAATDLVHAATGANVEVRPVWKPLHLQPAYHGSRTFLNGTAQSAFDHSVCLPSGSGMSDSDCQRVAELFAGCHSPAKNR